MIRYAILYFFLFIVFLLLIVGPIVASKFISINMDLPLDLLQPTGLNNNDTLSSQTGTALVPGQGGGGGGAATGGSGDSGSGATAGSSGGGGSAATTDPFGARRVKFF